NLDRGNVLILWPHNGLQASLLSRGANMTAALYELTLQCFEDGGVGGDRIIGKRTNHLPVFGVERRKARAAHGTHRHERQTLDRGPKLLHQGVAAAILGFERAGLERPSVIRRLAEILLESDIALGRPR